jgi:replicative DNA helicase
MKKENKILQQEFDLQGHILPQAIEFEEAVLGAMMLEQNAMDKVIGILKEEMFYKESHQKIFSAIFIIYKENNPIDLLSVTKKLKEEKNYEFVGGAYYIASLTNRVVSSANIEYHARIIQEKYLLRKIIEKSNEQIKLSYENLDPIELVKLCNINLDEINNITHGKLKVQTLKDISDECLIQMTNRCDNFKNNILNGIPTNLKSLDNILGGLQGDKLIILAGRPSMKKTAQALCMANTASEFGYIPAFFSLEMSNISLVDRLLLAESGLFIDSIRYQKGDLQKHEKEAIISAAIKLKSQKFYLDPNPIVDIYYIGSTLRRMVTKGMCHIAFIDYLQLVESEKVRGKNREQEVAETSRYLKILAKELNIPIVLLAQLSRRVEERKSDQYKPMLSDLRESGAIEQDADIVMFMYRPEYYGIKEDSNGISTENKGFVIVAKNRNGILGEASFISYPSPYKIVDIETVNTHF